MYIQRTQHIYDKSTYAIYIYMLLSVLISFRKHREILYYIWQFWFNYHIRRWRIWFSRGIPASLRQIPHFPLWFTRNNIFHALLIPTLIYSPPISLQPGDVHSWMLYYGMGGGGQFHIGAGIYCSTQQSGSCVKSLTGSSESIKHMNVCQLYPVECVFSLNYACQVYSCACVRSRNHLCTSAYALLVW